MFKIRGGSSNHAKKNHSRSIPEVIQRRAWSLLRWETTWEQPVSGVKEPAKI